MNWTFGSERLKMSRLIKLEPNLASIHFIYLQQYPCKIMHGGKTERVNTSNFSTRQFGCSEFEVCSLLPYSFLCHWTLLVPYRSHSVCGWQSCSQRYLPLCVYPHSQTLQASTLKERPLWTVSVGFVHLCTHEYTFMTNEWQAGMYLCWPVLTRESFQQC